MEVERVVKVGVMMGVGSVDGVLRGVGEVGGGGDAAEWSELAEIVEICGQRTAIVTRKRSSREWR